MLIVLLISAALFLAVTSFCRRQGLFDASSMGVGQLFSVVLYLMVWVLPSVLMFAGVWIKG